VNAAAWENNGSIYMMENGLRVPRRLVDSESEKSG
jgi:hypothetical protein